MSAPGDRSLLIEEFDRLFGYRNDEPHGVRNWVISTLGPTRVGKTVLISALYAQFYLGIERRKSMGIESVGTGLHDMLEGIAKGLRDDPVRLPKRTDEILNAQLKFLVKGERKTYQKILTLQDHPGEGLDRSKSGHIETMDALRSSDSFMVFIDSRELLKDDEEFHDAATRMELEVLKGLIRDISNGLEGGDLIPVSFALSKADLIRGREAEAIQRCILLMQSLSVELRGCVFCFTTTSSLNLLDDDIGDSFIFSPKNTAVPFLFSIAGTVVRNANFLKLAAEQVIEERDELKSEKIEGLGFFKSIIARVRKGAEVRRLDSKSKRYVSLSAYDLELAQSAIDFIKLHKNVTFMRRGKVYDDVDDVFPDLI